LRRKQPPYREDHTQADTLTFPVGNNVSASLRNYVSGKHLYLGKYVSVDNEGFDFLGFRIQRQLKRGSGKRYIYTYPSRKALASITSKVKTISRQNPHQPLAVLLHRLAPVLRGWANYFRHGTSKATFDYLRHYTWRRVIVWLRRKHPRATWKWLRRHHLPGWWPSDGATRLFDVMTVPVTRYRYRAANIPTPWQQTSTT
jgi:RNA-directed DNA polymerase